MTGDELFRFRRHHDLKARDMAEVLRLAPKGGWRTVLRWERAPAAVIGGPAGLALDMIAARPRLAEELLRAQFEGRAWPGS